MPRNSTQYGLGHTRTFRRASKKLHDLWGSNLQNLESSVRQIYIPDGFSLNVQAKCKYWLETNDISVFTEEELLHLRVFVQSDQAGAEALVVAYLCRPGRYRQIFEQKINPHAYLALHLFKEVWKKKMKEKGGMIEDLNVDELCECSIPDLKTNPYWYDLALLIKESDDWGNGERYYYYAKQTGHSANYGIEDWTFRMNVLEKSGGKVVIPEKDAKMYLSIYRSLYPEIPEWNEEIRRIVIADEPVKYLFNLFGHPYTITNYNNLDNDIKEYIAWIPQSTVGEITLKAVTSMQEHIERDSLDVDMLADTHDSLMSQCPLALARDVRKWQEDYLCQTEFESPVDGAKFRMRSETKIGFNWSSRNKTNELGLQIPKWL